MHNSLMSIIVYSGQREPFNGELLKVILIVRAVTILNTLDEMKKKERRISSCKRGLEVIQQTEGSTYHLEK